MQAANLSFHHGKKIGADPESLRIKSITHVFHGELRCAKSGPRNQPESRGSANFCPNPEGLEVPLALALVYFWGFSSAPFTSVFREILTWGRISPLRREKRELG